MPFGEQRPIRRHGDMPKFYSDTLDEELSYERVESFSGGLDGYTRATLLPPDSFQYGENTLVPDNGGIKTRAGAGLLGSAFADTIQGMLYFDIASAEQLIVAANQAFSYWNGSSWTAMAGFTLTDADLRIACAQGVDTALFSDGTAQMQIWNGSTWSGALGSTDIDPPVGATILLWHAGRMWAAGFPGSSSGKEQDAIWASALLAFGTGNWNATDRNFRVGAGDGDPITGLASIPPFTLAVLKQNSIWLVETDPTAVPANYASEVASETVSFGTGCVGKRAFCVYGNDLLFVSPDKSIRSLQRMQAAAGQYQLSAPISLPIEPFMDRINWSYAHLIAAVKYRELALFSVPLDSATYPDTVLVWNGRLQKWVGIWTGWTANCFEVSRFSGVQRLVHGDNSGNVRQWKDGDDQTLDATYLDDSTAIATKIWSRAFLFAEPLNDKDAYHAEIRFALSNAVATVSLVADDAVVKTWSADARPNAPTLPLTLPFDLVNPTNTPRRKGLRGLQPWNEAYLKIESTAGWFEVRNISMSAFVNTLASL